MGPAWGRCAPLYTSPGAHYAVYLLGTYLRLRRSVLTPDSRQEFQHPTGAPHSAPAPKIRDVARWMKSKRYGVLLWGAQRYGVLVQHPIAFRAPHSARAPHRHMVALRSFLKLK
jgi:hypothetical protein